MKIKKVLTAAVLAASMMGAALSGFTAYAIDAPPGHFPNWFAQVTSEVTTLDAMETGAQYIADLFGEEVGVTHMQLDKSSGRFTGFAAVIEETENPVAQFDFSIDANTGRPLSVSDMRRLYLELPEKSVSANEFLMPAATAPANIAKYAAIATGFAEIHHSGSAVLSAEFISATRRVSNFDTASRMVSYRETLLQFRVTYADETIAYISIGQELERLFTITTPVPFLAQRQELAAAQPENVAPSPFSNFINAGLFSQSASLLPPQENPAPPTSVVNEMPPADLIPSAFQNTVYGPHNPCDVAICPYCNGTGGIPTNCRGWRRTAEGRAYQAELYIRGNMARPNTSGGSGMSIRRCWFTGEDIVYMEGTRLTREETQAFLATFDWDARMQTGTSRPQTNR
ncbi:MAG: hypothetical protein FWB96_09540 [Defluviitaleaceae bacterium]|nr:hypothetical protein [Defluviitaleaceae bacterium]MCL2263059.1 hypothetical protein [Defluviitaleaceae bacterium]